jgi:ParB family chromosome partitioning protein
VSRKIPLSSIDRDPTQPRQIFDQEALDELAGSIMTIGLQQPVVVKPTAEGRYMLVMGERRWRACQLAELTEIDAIIDESGQDTFVKSVAENIARRDMTVLEEAKAFQRLVDKGMSIEDVGLAVGRRPERVTERIELLRLKPQWLDALAKGHVKPSIAWYTSRLTGANQDAVMQRYLRGEFVKEEDAKSYARALFDGEQQMGMWADDLTPEEKDEIRATRKKVTTQIEKLSGAHQVLIDIGQLDVNDVAAALAGADGGVGAYLLRIDHMLDSCRKVRTLLRNAQGVAKATELREEIAS